MSRSSKLFSNLKAADRRRRRRSVDSVDSARELHAEHPQTRQTSVPTTDVVSLLIDAALQVADQSSQVRDSAIIAALRAIISGHPPQGIALAVYSGMVRGLDAAHVDEVERRKCAAEFLAVAIANTSPESSRQLITYLSLIAS